MASSYGCDDNDDLYATIGTPFDIPEEDEQLPKATKIEDQIVTDQRGKRRFHGAFTGGFSAGYFNTVGSKEGWAPSTFLSSRMKKKGNEDIVKQTAEDYMDEEDFADHGIAPKKLKTAIAYNLTENELDNEKKYFQNAVESGALHSAIPGGLPLDALLAPSSLSVGVNLLKKMGWKPGQGVGEKVHLDSEVYETTITNKKVYGCALPPSCPDESIDIQSFRMMLAPKDIQPIPFTRKDNFHGIGYSGIISFNSLPSQKDNVFHPAGSKKKGIRGQAFGIGVFEDEDKDDNIYGDEALSAYDMSMEDESHNDLDGWSGAPKAQIYKGCLLGFIKSIVKLSSLERSPLFKLPAGFVPRHVFPCDQQNAPKESDGKLNSKDRSILLGESTKGLNDVNKWTLKWDQGSTINNNRDPDKGKDKSILIDGKKNSLMTEWGREQELSKSIRESALYKPLVSAIADRFTRANFKDMEKNSNDQGKYEDITEKKGRTVLTWHPDPLICKRLNIANPYPNSNIKGVPERVKKQASLFSDGLTGSVKAIAPAFEAIQPEEVKCEDEDGEEDYFTRISKGNIKSVARSKGTIGPLSHLNIKINITKNDVDSNTNSGFNVSHVDSNVNSKENITDSEINSKPSIDIFKAIFEDSDSDTDLNQDQLKEVKKENSPKINESFTKSQLSIPQSKHGAAKEECGIEQSKSILSDLALARINQLPRGGEKSGETVSKADNSSCLPLSFLNLRRDGKIPIIDSQTSDEIINKVSWVAQVSNINDKRENNKTIVPGKEYRQPCFSDKHDKDCPSRDYVESMKDYHHSTAFTKFNNNCKSSHTGKLNNEKHMSDCSLKHDETFSFDDCCRGDKCKSETDDSKKRHYVKKMKKKKEKKSKKRKKKKHGSEDIDSDDNTHRKKNKKKHKQRRKSTSPSSPDNDTIIPSNSILIEKLKRLSQSSKRPRTADFM